MWRDPDESDLRFLVTREGASIDDRSAAAAPAAKRNKVRGGRRLHARHTFDTSDDVVHALDSRAIRRVALARHVEPEGHQRRGLEADACVLQIEEAANEQ